MSLNDEKQELRRIAKEKRASLARQGGKDAAENLADNFFRAAGQDISRTVAGYWPMADEIDVRPLMTRLFEAGRTVLVVNFHDLAPLMLAA